MKKIFTIILISSFTINTSFAQPGEGTWLLGATTDATSSQGWSNIPVQPTIGYFLTDQFVLGLGLDYQTSSLETGADYINLTTFENGDSDEAKVTSNSLNLSPWARVYINERFFIHAGLNIGSGSNKLTFSGDLNDFYDNAETKSASFGFDVGPGFSLLWGEYVAIEPGMLISMTSGSTTPDGGDKIKDPTTFSVGFRIGIAVMLSE